MALLTALAVVLNGLTVPAPFAGFLLYGIWEIPVLLALLMLGFWGGVTVAALNGVALEFVNPGGLPTGPFYNFIAEVSMFVGILALQRVARSKRLGWPTVVAGGTAAGALTRTGVMTVVNWFALAQPYPIGFGPFVTQAQVPGYLVLIGAFNITASLYIIPVAFSISKGVATRFAPKSASPAQPFTP